ncbi:MAG: fructose-specific PTS transporter subunit EIIC [Actinobacteria bacterium]|nr:fructose-specific PTS transporter subunit EIIC [Actinomycetota bacterium]
MSEPLITPDLVLLDVDLGSTKTDVIHRLAALVAKTGRADEAGLAADALAREEKAVTGLGGGIAIPHCRSAAVNTNTLAFARLNPKVEFGAADGPADLAFMIAASEGSDDAHLTLLAMLARSLMRAEFLEGLRSATTPEQIVALVNEATAPEAPAEPAAAAVAAAAPAGARKLIVAVTACPTGIAHTFMAADGLEQAGKAAGIELVVEPQGSGKVEWLDPSLIARADAAIFATDVPVRDKERFAGLPVIESGVKRAINEPAKLVSEALAAAANPNAAKVAGTASAGAAAAGGGSQLSVGKRVQQALMTGVSYMIPFVAAGGLLLALGFLFGGFDIALSPGVNGARTCAQLTWLSAADCQAGIDAGKSIGALAISAGWASGINYLGAVLFAIGGAAFGFLVPALSGYIAYALAGRPGIAPGFVGGAISVTLGAGFIGGLITGLLAGVLALWISSFKVKRWLAGLMPVVIIPLVVTFLVGGLMYFLLGKPLAALTQAMQDGLSGMSGGSAILLGIVLGLMMCFDLGGPVNKAAYLFATAGLSAATAANFNVMAAVMAAGMVPPLAMALATVVRKKLFTEVERENGTAAWLLGASFISEGAIPFAAADPLRVIPSMMLGGAVTGALSMALGVGLRAPHGGIFVLFAFQPLPAAIFGFLISLAAGVAVAAAAVIAAKTIWPKKEVVAVS